MSILFKEIEDLRQRLAVAEGDAKHWLKKWEEQCKALITALEERDDARAKLNAAITDGDMITVEFREKRDKWESTNTELARVNLRLQSSLEAANAEVEQLRHYRTVVSMMKLSELIALAERRGCAVDIHLKPNRAKDAKGVKRAKG
jgi:ATP phosphoribosyltransferase regulatory subunit HisZ